MAQPTVTILNHGRVEDIARRVGKLGFKSQANVPHQVKFLRPATSGELWLVPFGALQSPDWPQLRVRFAQSNRYFIVVGEDLSSADIMMAARDGAFDTLLLKDDDGRWTAAFEKLLDSQKLWLQLYGGVVLDKGETLLGQSAAMKSLRQAIDRLGPTDASVLLLGESGVGKEKVASGLHKASGRGPFVAVNCSAIPKELIEAELFGAERGAFTGATRTRTGLVEQASGGTLFLDEIGELDIAQQPKLLRFLETRRARRVGGSVEIPVEVRVLSATNGNLDREIGSGKFRMDLYYRLSEVILQIPPLRTRPEDIPHLALAFLRSASERFGKHFETLEPELVARFQQYDWPGNVRELKNALDRMVILYDGPVLRDAWWVMPLRPTDAARSMGLTDPGGGGEAAAQVAVGRGAFPNKAQRLALARQLLTSRGHDLAGIAAELGIHPTTLYRWRKDGKV